MEELYNALEMNIHTHYSLIIFKIISVFLTFLLVKDANDYAIYGGITIFTTSASNILNFINARKYIYIKKYERYNLKKHIGPIIDFHFMSSIILQFILNLTLIMIWFKCGCSV